MSDSFHFAGTASPQSSQATAQVVDLFRRLFSRFDENFFLRLWDGAVVRLGSSQPGAADPRFTLACRSPGALRAMLLGQDPLRFADAYFHGDIDIEGDFFAALGLKDHLHSIRLSYWDRLNGLFALLRLSALKGARPNGADRRLPFHEQPVAVHSRDENREAIRFHYDISNRFYALWLDPAMVYSCAYFENAQGDLEDAQRAKLDHICRKLMLKPGDYLLDIGCGWGALVIHAARHYGVYTHGITLSPRQLQLARRRIALAGLTDRVKIELRDYRDLQGDCLYDKIASVGMFEHVGLANLPAYFAVVHRLLKPSGVFLNHGITHDVEGWERTTSTEFINRYVFPDGQLDTVSNIQRAMERAGFEIADVESLRNHYALTLRRWVSKLERNHEESLQYVSESTYRVWRLYMAACALEFDSGELGLYQLLASKRSPRSSPFPLTRRHLYSVGATAE